MFTKDTTILISSAEDMAEADQVLVLHPQRRPPTASPSNLRLRLMFLVGVASLALICIVLISQQLIVRHMHQQPAHLVLEVNLPQQQQPFNDQMRQQFSDDLMKHFSSQGR